MKAVPKASEIPTAVWINPPEEVLVETALEAKVDHAGLSEESFGRKENIEHYTHLIVH